MYRSLTEKEIATLSVYGCSAENWIDVEVKESFAPDFISNVHFSGKVQLGIYEKTFTLPGGFKKHSGLINCCIHNSTIGDNTLVENIANYIANYNIGNDCFISNTNQIVVDGESTFGNGVKVPVMNEGGGREIPIFDQLSASLAYIMTLYRHRDKVITQLQHLIDQYADRLKSSQGKIGNNVTITNCGSLQNVLVGDYAQIAGASTLENGTIHSKKIAPTIIGSGVKCNDFILSTGVSITDSALISKCFIGQSCIMGKQYSALDSLFFSNCQGMHGEATAIFGGPYTVSHHKSTLLIAGMFSFLNAGSGSNQSNHMYKLGPIHQGMTERGAKTTSDSYVLWPAKIGAFTLVMGRHTSHADTSELPFSYLIENATESTLVPAINLKSVGTVRDAQKWPKRDNRTDNIKLDLINFNLLSPYTIQKMMKGIKILVQIQKTSGETSDFYYYQNCKITNSALVRGIDLYQIGIVKFIGNTLISKINNTKCNNFDELKQALNNSESMGKGTWIDLAGLIAPRKEIKNLLAEIETEAISLEGIQKRFEDIHNNYYQYEWNWVKGHLEEIVGKPTVDFNKNDLIQIIEKWIEAVVKLDKFLYQDAKKEFNLNSQTGFGIDGEDREKSADFESVRGNFENNTFVKSVLNHIEKKTALSKSTIKKIKEYN